MAVKKKIKNTGGKMDIKEKVREIVEKLRRIRLSRNNFRKNP